MKNEYRKQFEQIKAPKSLIEKTRLEMRKLEQEQSNEIDEVNNVKQQSVEGKILTKDTESHHEKERKKPAISVVVRLGVLAAALLLVVGGGYGIYQSQNNLSVASIVRESDGSFEAEQNFGQGTGHSEKDNFDISKGSSEKVIPQFLRETKSNKVQGIEVWLAEDENHLFYAGYQKEDLYYYIIGKNISKEEFITFVKERLK
ncbi:hypothetical protein ACYSNR_11295 [Enterococcus sp. LJL128]